MSSGQTNAPAQKDREIVDTSIMTPKHPLWQEFFGRMLGPEGCNFRKNDAGDTIWDCGGGDDLSRSRAILTDMGLDVEGSLKYLSENGGHCDCEVLFNLDNSEE